MKTLTDKFPHLITQTDFREQNKRGLCVTANIRAHLKNLYPDTKFSVKNNSSIDINWIDGPTSEKVKSALSIFDHSDNDIMTDYFGIKSTEFTDLFGGHSFIFTRRDMTDGYKQKILDRMNSNRHADNSITLENMKHSDYSNYFSGDDHNNSFSHDFWNDFNEVEAADAGGYKTESEILKTITLENYTTGLIHDALKQAVPTFYLDSYLYYSQPQLIKQNTDNISSQKQRIIELTEEYRCKKEGIETPQERKTRLANEYNQKVQARIDSIKPVSVELLENRLDVNVKMPALNKNCTLYENSKEIEKESNINTYELYKIITLNHDDYNFVSDNLLQNIPNLWGKYPENYYINQEERIAHYPVIKVVVEGDKDTNFIVDTQGYSYARYVGEEHRIEQQPMKTIINNKIYQDQFASVIDFLDFKQKNTAQVVH